MSSQTTIPAGLPLQRIGSIEVIAESGQIRMEADDVGPLYELRYWRYVLCRLSSVVEFVQSNKFLTVIKLLTAAQSRILKSWMEQDRKLTDKINEARDNVKYLHQLEKICFKFYENDMETIRKSIPLLISQVQMIHAISRFYHTPEHITSFFTKVTNQIVVVCKNYITESGKVDLWTLPRQEAISRMNKCVKLEKNYKRSLEKVRKRVSSEIGKRNFEFFQVPVLGAFSSFSKRLNTICEMFDVIDGMSVLNKCHIEGIEVFSTKLNNIVNGMKGKTYDLLDHRKLDFDNDYKEFTNQIAELKENLQQFINKQYIRVKQVHRSILTLKRYEDLKIPGLDTTSQYTHIFKFFEQEMNTIRRPYITVLHIQDQQRVFQTYNLLAEILTEFMILHHNAYCRKIKTATKELQKSILVTKSTETGVEDWEINFTDTLYMMLQDSRSMIELQLNIPDEGKFLLANYDKLLRSKVKMQELLHKFKVGISEIPLIFEPLISPMIKRVECALRPGVTYLQWLSTKIDDYIANVKKNIENLEFVKWKATDTNSTRLNSLLDDIQNISLFKLPSQPCDPEDFVSYVEEISKSCEETLYFKCLCFDKNVDELLSFLLEEGKLAYHECFNVDLYGGTQKNVNPLHIKGSGDRIHFEEEKERLLEHFEILLAKALGKCANKSLDTLSSVFRYSGRIKPVIKQTEKSKPEETHALFLTYLVIQDNTVAIDPSMITLQTSLNGGVSVIQKTIDNVAVRRENVTNAKRPQKPLQPGEIRLTFHRRVLDLSDLQRHLAFLDSAGKSIQPEISKVYKIFLQFEHVWAQDREKEIQEFMEKNPFHDVYELKRKLEFYTSLEKDISEIPFSYTIAGFELQTDRITERLLTEVRRWFTSYGNSINRKYLNRANEISDFMHDKDRIINLPVKELSDVQRAMNCFETVQENFIDIDMDLEPIQDAYALLIKFKFPVDLDEHEKAKTLPKTLDGLVRETRSVANELSEKQYDYLETLKQFVETFKVDVEKFDEDYKKRGPMVEGITPEEASQRVDMFSDQLNQLYGRYESYKDGEELFALPVSEYPSLVQSKKDMVLLQKLFTLFNQVMKKITGYFQYTWENVDVQVMTEELTDFQNKCMRLPKGCKDWSYFNILKQRIEDFKETCPLLTRLRNEAMTMNHWKRIEKVCNHKFDEDQSKWTLGTVMEAPLLVFKDDVEDICIAAEKEREIEAKLNQIFAEWAVENLFFSNFKNRGELLLKGTEAGETVVKLEDGLMTLGSLLSNRYSAAMKDIILKWLQYLTTATEVIENWLVVQNLWVYLEAVFVGGDIAKQLPKEAERFSDIDTTWVKLMERAHEKVNVIKCCAEDDTMSTALPHLLEELEACQKSLVGYLESKRRIFPRFFFISDPALLEILGQASDSHTIQAHLLGVFENVFNVRFDPDEYNKITAVISKEGDEIPLDRPVMAEGNVELWLGDLLVVQQMSLNTVIKEAFGSLNEEDFELITFIDKYIAQVALLGIQILWTRDGEEALTFAKISKKIMTFTNKKFGEILRKLIAQTTLDLSSFVRVKYETLITIHVHQKTFLKICYITLAQALGMSMGGAPAGPAGTGKTETTKDMGKALGKYVVVFNCSDQMDFRGLGRIYKGLAQSGSWGCFDEFNRIELPVLSVAAQQISIVLSARKEKQEEFVFSDGDILSLNPEFGLFITMNPGYAGRQELPENLKVMFRSVAMMVPDRQIIMRVKLASCGFQENSILARKFFVLYKLCEEQLTKQVHYDFGLRNILSVLRTLGAQKRSRPEESESSIVMSVLSSMNISKLVDEDEPLFESLINDLFPGITKEAVEYDDLQIAIADQVKAANLINHPQWNLKVIQLYETQMVRHGMMALGPSGAGKTCCIRILMRAMTDCGAPHKEMRMNPKAITASQMFGRLDVATNDWTDGIFSTLWRRTLKTKKDEHVWLILDGPVDAIWIENLNSVLDDNKTLTLANGDRIPMSPTCKIIFEPHNIDNASPATVSRNGMVYMSSSGLHWEPILEGWLSLRSPTEATILRGLFGKVFQALCQYALVSLIPKMELLECNYIKQAMDLLDGLLPDVEITAVHYERLFIFAMMWSFGALLELEDRSKMQIFLTKHKPKLDLPKMSPATKETIFEYMVDAEGNWLHWSNRVEEYIYPTDSIPTFSSILVPNVDNVRTNFLIDTIQKQQKSVLLIGEQGTAKTVMIKGYLNSADPTEYTWKNLSFSSATTPEMFQRAVESIVEKKVGTTYGPPGGKKMTIFIDDINMPEINEWGDQVTNEIVRQLMENKGFYSLDKPGDFSTVVDIRFISAMIQPGGGRNDIPSRLKRQFSVFNCTLPAATSIDKIFGIIGGGYFCKERFTEEIVEFVSSFVPATRILWQDTKIKMLPTPAKFHYVFNLRDLSRIWEGMLKIENDECSSKEDLLALWKHECTRVIADRFTNDEDKDWFLKKMEEVVNNEIGSEYLEILPEEPYFVNFMRDPPEPEDDEAETILEMPLIYEQIPSFEELAERLRYFMHQYNEGSQRMQMDLVFFKDAMVHLVKISRIISTPQGSALLVGVGGSGKQSLTRLAASIYKHEIFQITLTRSYNIGNLVDDLKILYKKAGEEGKGVSFIFTDNEIKEESFLEYLNTILGSGEVANLFPKDELREIMDNLLPVMKRELPKREPNQDNLYDFFLSRSRANLHIVLCFSPAGGKFQKRSLKFPGLISGCTMDWLTSWPTDALIAVSTHFIQQFDIETTPDVKTQLMESMGVMHDTVSTQCNEYFQRYRRLTYVTPKSYLAFINGYKAIYTEKRTGISGLASRINSGLTKLQEATISVNELKVDLAIKEKDLVVASAEVDEVVIDVKKKTESAEIVKNSVQVVKDRAQKIVDKISVEKAIAEEKLEAAKPALEAAEAALQTINAGDIATVRKLPKPPHLIMRIMDCVLILFQEPMKPTVPDPERACPTPSWEMSLKVMSSGQFLNSLFSFPKDNINGEMVELMEPYITMPDYSLESALKTCGQVAGLLSWTLAMASFFAVNKEVLPLKANLGLLEVQNAKASKELAIAQAELDEKQAELDVVNAIYNEAMAKKQDLQDTAETCKRKMIAAEALIAGLQGEKERWTEDSKRFQSQINRLAGDAVLLAAFLSYSGPFNQEFRMMLFHSWRNELVTRNIPLTEDLNLIDALTDAPTIAEWGVQGLPNDELSLQNGIVVTKSERYPLLIDPQGQGKSWIIKKEEKNSLIVTNLNHKFFRQFFEDALSQGRPLLIEDVGEELDPVLDNVLDQKFCKIRHHSESKMGDKDVDFLKTFKLYITTKLPNPTYAPEVTARTSVIDFTVTMKGLEDQLLGRVILAEKQELEAERVALLENVANNKRKTKELEDNLLHKLATTEGSLVDDESLIEVLKTTKETAADVAKQLDVADATNKMINLAREEYRPGK
ncbi:dynein heavy chain 8, axonemal [Caerostris darwini]|uniref:Dynein heavy chain 8, axonemal n=1 Tax=Caerostris darwini TaxID=1538125 RepID=A0AAV4R624_9ARAC|nr:dynein heavy chain 8, axonemal [Caerostris darwini]